MPETRASHDAHTTLRPTAHRSPRKRRVAVLEADERLERASASSLSGQLSSLFAYNPSIKKRTIATTQESSELGEIGPSSVAAVANLSQLNSSTKPSISTQRVAGPREKKKKTIQIALESPHSPPNNWSDTYALIKEIRSSVQAPVDVMGCHSPMKADGDPRVCH